MNKAMENVLNLVCDEIEKIGKQSALDQVSLKNLDTLIDIKKDIVEINAMESGSNNYGNESVNRMYNNGYSSTPGYSNYGNGSWDRRGYYIQPYYNSNGMSMNGMGHMNNGYSRAASEEEMRSMLYEMANNVSADKADMIHDFLNQFDQMK